MCSLSCKEQDESGGKVAARDISTVLDAHASELMQITGVTGVAEGALDDGTPCILVLILEDSEQITSQIPNTLEGHPVKTMVSGPIRPMAGDSGG
jgi:hypothetical protein